MDDAVKYRFRNIVTPEESHGRRSLAGYSPQGRKESDMTERLHFSLILQKFAFMK